MNPASPAWTTRDVRSPWFRVGTDDVRLLRDGVEALPAMLKAIRDARREVLLEMYWIGADDVGAAFRDALAEKAHEGVTVRVVYDAVGSLAIGASFWRRVLDAGGDVRDFHPLFPLRPTFDLARLEVRDHRKLLVVDGQVGFTGGLNLAQPWLPRADGGGGWRDDMVEVRGHASAELRTLFYKTWRRIAAHKLPRTKGGSRGPRDLAPLSRHPRGPVYVLANSKRTRRNLRFEYLSRIQRAERSIDIANSYFVPDRYVRRALFRAIGRGVRVRVLVPRKSDIAAVQFALEAMYDLLLRSGVELYQYGGPMMHAKTAVIDDRFATIGSYNLDERSRRKNLEVNVAVEDVAFASHVRGWFDRDVARAERVDLYTWRARPLVRRGIERLAHALRKLW